MTIRYCADGEFELKCLFSLVSLLTMAGCAAPYSQFYHDNMRGADITKDRRFADAPSEPVVMQGKNPETDGQSMAETGYVQIGYSSFNGADVNASGAVRQAKIVHAHQVLVYSKYTQTLSGAMPLTLPDTQTSTTSLNGNAYGPGGTASFSGTAYTTTTGTKTTYIPYSVNRYDYLATYWVKRKSFVLGVFVQDLTSEIRQALQSNKGVIVTVVVKGTPAFQADILKGDVLRMVGSEEIYDEASFGKAIRPYAGQQVVIQLIRNGTPILKEVQLDRE